MSMTQRLNVLMANISKSLKQIIDQLNSLNVNVISRLASLRSFHRNIFDNGLDVALTKELRVFVDDGRSKITRIRGSNTLHKIRTFRSIKVSNTILTTNGNITTTFTTNRRTPRRCKD